MSTEPPLSAIFGIWRLDGAPVDRGSMGRMSARLAHRGAEEWVREGTSAGFGWRGRASSASNSIAESSAGILLIADARIDNRRELVAALGLDRAPERSSSDLLLSSYLAWGERCVERWRGDFAVAIWDPGLRRLLCARDPFGVRPLHYHHSPGILFAFASEVEALLAVDGVSDAIDELEVARHLLVPVGLDRAATYRRDVRRVEPAHVVAVSETGLGSRAHWTPDPGKELRLSSDEEYAEALRESFVEAVHCRIEGAATVASMLSGGIDSASIACVAAGLLAERRPLARLHGLSAVYPSVPESDERRSIDKVLERYPIVPHFFEADAVYPLHEIDRMNRLVGGASWAANLYLNWMLYGIAAEEGVDVVLDGFDGDATISHGLMLLPELARTGRWLALARASWPYSRRRGGSPVSDYLHLVRGGLHDPAPGSGLARIVESVRRKRRREPTNRDPGAAHPLLAPEFAGRFTGIERSAPDLPVTERESHARQIRSSVLLETIGWLEACAAGRGVELGLPFCDTRLVELCLSIPAEQKLRHGWTRYVMRRAMEGILPPDIQWRETKTELHAGWGYAIRSHRDGRIERIFADPNPEILRYLNLEAVSAMYERWLNGGMRALEERALWRAIFLALWLSPVAQFADGGKTQP